MSRRERLIFPRQPSVRDWPREERFLGKLMSVLTRAPYSASVRLAPKFWDVGILNVHALSRLEVDVILRNV